MAEPTSLMAIAIENAGIRRGAQAAAVVVSWATAINARGRALGDDGGDLSAAIRDYADYWRVSERTAWRELHRFRRGFPGEESPARLAGLVADVVAARREAAVTQPIAGLVA